MWTQQHFFFFLYEQHTTFLLCFVLVLVNLNLIYFTHLRIFSHAIACIIRALSVNTVGDSRNFFFFLTFFVFFA